MLKLAVSSVLAVSIVTGCASGTATREEEELRQRRLQQQEQQQRENQERENKVQAERQRLVYARSISSGFTYSAMAGWEKAFSDRESAQKWLEDIVKRVHTVSTAVNTKKQLYEKNGTSLNNSALIEAYRGYEPVNADIEKVLAKGVTFEIGQNDLLLGSSSFHLEYPGLTASAVTSAIAALEKNN
jgi:hypothetical protein